MNMATRTRSRNIFFFSTLLILSTSPLSGREKTDVIVMKNGDRMTCEIKQLDHDVLFLGLDYVDGTVSVHWADVARLQSKQLFLVRTEDGSAYTGLVSSAETAGIPPAKIYVA